MMIMIMMTIILMKMMIMMATLVRQWAEKAQLLTSPIQPWMMSKLMIMMIIHIILIILMMIYMVMHVRKLGGVCVAKM